MAIIFNGTTVDKVIFNGAEMETVKFEGVVVFENKPQLATPQNVTADGTNVSWDEVENATSYEVIEGGNNVLGTYTPTYTVKVNYSIKQINDGIGNGIRIYDGGENGTLLFKKDGSQNQTITGSYEATITTGFISLAYWSGSIPDLSTNIQVTEGLIDTGKYWYPFNSCTAQIYRVTQDATVTFTIKQT